jgi:hypothetical protein
MKTIPAVLLLGFSLAWTPTPQSQSSPDVNLQVVKYDGLKDAIHKHRGQVVLVDFWGNF